jgi:hypothetical protein
VLTFSKPQKHLIDHNRILCPLRGDIDIERCVSCSRLRSIELDGHDPAVTCQASTSPYCCPIVTLVS